MLSSAAAARRASGHVRRMKVDLPQPLSAARPISTVLWPSAATTRSCARPALATGAARAETRWPATEDRRKLTGAVLMLSAILKDSGARRWRAAAPRAAGALIIQSADLIGTSNASRKILAFRERASAARHARTQPVHR